MRRCHGMEEWARRHLLYQVSVSIEECGLNRIRIVCLVDMQSVLSMLQSMLRVKAVHWGSYLMSPGSKFASVESVWLC